MSVRRRASIAGLDFKNNFPNSSVSGNGFGRRMSIASLGSHKYGRAEDQSQSNNGGGGGGGGVVIRHIPILIEGEEHKNEERQERALQSTNILNVPPRFGRSADRSSTSSTESDNSVETSSSTTRPGRNSHGNKKRQTIASVRKSSNPKYVVVEETVGADHCPVHGHHHHHHHHHHHQHHQHYNHHDQEDGGRRRAQCGGKGGAADDQQTQQVFADELKAPSLIRSSVTGGEEDNHQHHHYNRKSWSQRGRPRHNNILTPIKENISQDTNTFQRNSRHGSFKEGRKSKAGEDEEDKLGSKPFQRRWSVRLPLPSHSSQSSSLEPRQSESRQMAGLRGSRLAQNLPAKTDGTSVSTSELRAASSTVIGKMTLQAGPGAGGANEGLAGAKQPPCVGILKTPGRRKTSNNRVEFLDNLQEREIPGRYT